MAATVQVPTENTHWGIHRPQRPARPVTTGAAAAMRTTTNIVAVGDGNVSIESPQTTSDIASLPSKGQLPPAPKWRACLQERPGRCSR